MQISKLISGVLLAALSLNVWAIDGAALVNQGAESVADVSFKDHIQPILQDHCVSCHSPNARGFTVSGLDLTSYEGVMKGTRFGKVVIPGNSEQSTFTKLLTGTNKGLKMPAGLNESGTLDKRYIAAMRKWVKQGAKNN